MSASDAASDKALHPFLDQLPNSELYPVGKTSWAAVSAAVKKDIGQAVAPGGSPEGVLGRLQAAATDADTRAAN
jgi:multiple sugar transport system substrate-binding protein